MSIPRAIKPSCSISIFFLSLLISSFCTHMTHTSIYINKHIHIINLYIYTLRFLDGPYTCDLINQKPISCLVIQTVIIQSATEISNPTLLLPFATLLQIVLVEIAQNISVFPASPSSNLY